MKMQPVAQESSKPPVYKRKAFDDEHDDDHSSPRRAWWNERDDENRHQSDPANTPDSHTGDSHARDSDAPDSQWAPPSEHQTHAYSEPQGLTVAIGGYAAAAGDATSIVGFVENFAKDWGDYSIAMGEAVFEAQAYSCELGGAVAAADTFLDLSGADIVFAREVEQAILGLHDAWSRAELDYIAIDIEGWSPRQGQIGIEVDQPFDHYLASWQPSGHEPPVGNLAQVMATAEAYGANALSATLTNALAIENQFSFVHATGLVAV